MLFAVPAFAQTPRTRRRRRFRSRTSTSASARRPSRTTSRCSLQILLLLTVLSLAPTLLVLVTSFTRIVIVLSFVRTALGTQQVPPTQVLVGLALLLTFFVMDPVIKDINKNALQPY